MSEFLNEEQLAKLQYWLSKTAKSESAEALFMPELEKTVDLIDQQLKEICPFQPPSD